MLLFIVPTFAEPVRRRSAARCPLPTRILVALSEALKVGIIPLDRPGHRRPSRSGSGSSARPQVRNVVDPLKLKLPVFGELFQKIALTRFARNLGTMMKSGVPILQSLDIVADTTGNVCSRGPPGPCRRACAPASRSSKPLTEHPVFPPMVVQMMAVGEDTGALDTMLRKIAEFYDQEVEATTESLTALIEPLMIAFLGGIVGLDDRRACTCRSSRSST